MAMHKSHRRMAAIVIVMTLAVCMGTWRWQTQAPLAPTQHLQRPIQREAKPALAPTTTITSDDASIVTMQAELQQCLDAMQDNIRMRAEQLSQRSDATSQLAFALSAGFTVPSHAESDIQQAAHNAAAQAMQLALHLDPHQPDIAWLAAGRCTNHDECASAQKTLLATEPDNAAVWLWAMSRVQNSDDDAAAERAFQRAAHATQYNNHHGAVILVLLQGYAGLPTPAICQRPHIQTMGRDMFHVENAAFDTSTFVAILGSTIDVSLFSGMGLLNRCRPDESKTLPPQRQADCTHIATLLVNSDTLLERAVALSLLIEYAGNTPEGRQWREQLRQQQWMMEQLRAGTVSAPAAGLAADEYPSLKRSLQKSGHWPPPADWLPKDAGARSLIMDGRRLH